jgi:leader peptidase (prepilin peptidase)/N-methyltransferase
VNGRLSPPRALDAVRALAPPAARLGEAAVPVEAALLAVLVGLAVGSFLNVCIERLPKGESVVRPASRCPTCAAPLRWVENIPLVSYLLLRGRCRHCGARISWRYPVVEALTGSLVLLSLLRVGPGLRWLALAVLLCALVVVTFIDLDHQIIPHAITLPGIPLGILASVITGEPLPRDAAAGALIGAGLVYLIAVYADVAWQRESMGGGDVNLLAMIGAFLGWRGALLSFFIGVVAGAVVSVALLAVGRLSRKDRIPFGPFLALGAVVAVFAGDEVISWYGRLLR